MASGEAMGNLLALLIILAMIVIVYLKVAKKSIGEVITDIKEATTDRVEEVI